jgi:hypothetical protein
MTLSVLPLSYCTNVHPGRSLAEVRDGLTRYTLPIRSRFGQPLAAGLWLARPVIDELLVGDQLPRFADFLRQHDLTCHTLNSFPYGDFHSDRVKEQVYLPDWTHPDRQRYTLDCARVLTAFLPDGVDGSLSTVPLGFKALATSPDFLDRCIERLIATATGLAKLRDDTGRTIRLAIEPEPLCVLETTAETVAFFQKLRDRAEVTNTLDAVRKHLGVCYDVCHQAVEFEDVAASIRQLVSAGIRINKVHISCAIETPNPTRDPAVRETLLRYVEPRYLHQTFAVTANGGRVCHTDLDRKLIESPSPEFATAEVWRVHFHVPVDAERLGPLRTTRPDLQRALAVVPELPYAPHLEVETYTWEVLPHGGRTELVAGFAQELRATQQLLNNLPPPPH